jgi:ornithine racemase
MGEVKMYPRVEISLTKIRENCEVLGNMCNAKGISMWGVTKSFCAIPEIAEAMVKGGAVMLADSRINNLKLLKDISVPKVLLRIPMHTQVNEVVEYADYSLNSELSTLKLLGEAAVKIAKVHKIIVMVDLGDLREGIWLSEVEDFVAAAVKINGISIRGFGVNLTCYGGVIPNDENLSKLVNISREMEKKYNLNIEVISGGNSSSIYLLQNNRMTEGINNLRLGEVMLLGRETAFGNMVEGLYSDAFILKGEIIELKEKPSLPIGEIGMDAFGNVPTFEDRGIIKRAIIGFGRQDIDPSGITPFDNNISIIGGSSDHTIIDVTDCEKKYKVGDILEFYVDYGCLLRAMTSVYVNKLIIK